VLYANFLEETLVRRDHGSRCGYGSGVMLQPEYFSDPLVWWSSRYYRRRRRGRVVL
jgi:hypothetical protein